MIKKVNQIWQISYGLRLFQQLWSWWYLYNHRHFNIAKIRENTFSPSNPICQLFDRTRLHISAGIWPETYSESTKAWLENKNTEVLTWPAQSLDLNPIEIFLKLFKMHHLKQEIRKAKVSHIDQLVDTIKNYWYSISPNYCKKLSDSMPTRIDDTIRNKGSCTKY